MKIKTINKLLMIYKTKNLNKKLSQKIFNNKI